ncbi:hypothetical protein BDV93DRAFT_565439 [Ceratobasidium sp. AG-I]|nr:hypothetical protein BDV93DRAFT_565439 [Ceratobasidium sp. AG-I]
MNIDPAQELLPIPEPGNPCTMPNNRQSPPVSQPGFASAHVSPLASAQSAPAIPGTASSYNPIDNVTPTSGPSAIATVSQPSALPRSVPLPTQPQCAATPVLDLAADDEDLADIARELDRAEAPSTTIESQEFTPVHGTSSHTQLGLRARSGPRSTRLAKKDSSKTPQKKLLRANIAAHYAVNHGRRQQVPSAQAQPTEENQPADTAGSKQLGFSSAQLLVISPMRKYIAFYLITRTAWPASYDSVLDKALVYAQSIPHSRQQGEIEMDIPFRRYLRNKSSAVRGELVEEVLADVRTLYNVSPSTIERIDKLIENDRFLYAGEDAVSLKKRGFCGHPALTEAICAILFEHPANLGTLFMSELCQEDTPRKWHKKLKDRTATKGISIGLIAFAAIAILHMLECIRDRTPSGRKPYKFEQTRYDQTWTRYRKMLVGYRYLGDLRLECLTAVKERYNRNNRVCDDSDADLTDCGDSSDCDSDGTDDMGAAGSGSDEMEECANTDE